MYARPITIVSRVVCNQKSDTKYNRRDVSILGRGYGEAHKERSLSSSGDEFTANDDERLPIRLFVFVIANATSSKKFKLSFQNILTRPDGSPYHVFENEQSYLTIFHIATFTVNIFADSRIS